MQIWFTVAIRTYMDQYVNFDMIDFILLFDEDKKEALFLPEAGNTYFNFCCSAAFSPVYHLV